MSVSVFPPRSSGYASQQVKPFSVTALSSISNVTDVFISEVKLAGLCSSLCRKRRRIPIVIRIPQSQIDGRQ